MSTAGLNGKRPLSQPTGPLCRSRRSFSYARRGSDRNGRRISLSLVGVAIATALVPPLSTCSMLLARGDAKLAAGAFLLAFTNMVAIQFTSSVVFWIAGYGSEARFWSGGYRVFLRNLVSIVLLVILGVVLAVSTHRTVSNLLFEADVRKILRECVKGYPGAYLDEVRFDNADGKTLVRAIVRSPRPFSAQDVAPMSRQLPKAPNGSEIALRVRRVAVEVRSSDGGNMSVEMLYQHEWLIFVISSAIFFLATEVGFRSGHIRRSSADESTKSEAATFQGAILGLLALLLGFTISMALSRIEVRKEMVVEESNAIGTAYLRAQLLPEPEKTEISRLLRQYVDVRLEGADTGKLQDAITKSESLHDQLWLQAIAVGKKAPQPFPTGIFIQSLNEVIDVHSKRVRALMDQVPASILILLFTVAIFGMGAIGYGCGLANGHYIISRLSMAVLIAMVIVTIIDLDQPSRGLIKVSQYSMMSLRDHINKPAP